MRDLLRVLGSFLAFTSFAALVEINQISAEGWYYRLPVVAILTMVFCRIWPQRFVLFFLYYAVAMGTSATLIAVEGARGSWQIYTILTAVVGVCMMFAPIILAHNSLSFTILRKNAVEWNGGAVSSAAAIVLCGFGVLLAIIAGNYLVAIILLTGFWVFLVLRALPWPFKSK